MWGRMTLSRICRFFPPQGPRICRTHTHRGFYRPSASYAERPLLPLSFGSGGEGGKRTFQQLCFTSCSAGGIASTFLSTHTGPTTFPLNIPQPSSPSGRACQHGSLEAKKSHLYWNNIFQNYFLSSFYRLQSVIAGSSYMPQVPFHSFFLKAYFLLIFGAIKTSTQLWNKKKLIHPPEEVFDNNNED